MQPWLEASVQRNLSALTSHLPVPLYHLWINQQHFSFCRIQDERRQSFFFQSMLAPLRNQIFVSYLERCLQSITSEDVLTRQHQLPRAGLYNHSAAVFPIKQVCRNCSRCRRVGCSVMIWTALSTGQAANSLWLSPLSGLCCWQYNDLPPWN